MSIEKFNLEDRRILQIGFGSVGSAMPQMYEKHLIFKPKNIIIIDMNKDILPSSALSSFEFINLKVTRENYKKVLKKYLRPGDFLVDLAWYIDTLSLIKWCYENDVLFLNTAVEEWEDKMTKKEAKKLVEEVIEAVPEEVSKLEADPEFKEQTKEILRSEEKESTTSGWIPKTQLGRAVKSGKEKDLDKILEYGKKILEPVLREEWARVKDL
jgi:homospermidine synthase